MKLSEFELAMRDEFGAFGQVLRRDVVLSELGSRTVDEALEAGIPAREVWLALCRQQQVPESRRYGVGRPEPKRR